ncbi:MAG: glycogen debranching N-terminal domain-containing protein [Bacillota bacterium]
MFDLVIKEGDLFLVCGPSGDLAGGSAADGLFHRDTRYLSRLQLRVAGRSPRLLSGSASENYQMRFFYESDRPEPAGYGKLGVERRRVIEAGLLYEQVRVVNYSAAEVRVEVAIGFAADYRDLFELRGWSRSARGTDLAPEVGPDRVVLGYSGLDGTTRRTLIAPAPIPERMTAEEAAWVLHLQPGQSGSVTLVAAPEQEGGFPPAGRFEEALARLRRSYAEWEEQSTRLQTDNPLWNRTLERSRTDLRTLTTDLGYGPFPVAGIPWFAVPFGRDSIITAIQCLGFQPALAAGTLRTLAALQGRQEDGFRLEEPGKILHERRAGEMSVLGEVPFLRYYGTVDATPLFLVLLGEAYRWTGDLSLAAELLPNLKAAVEWCRTEGRRRGDGFLRYTADEKGLGVQSWKDSNDSICHRSGEPARSPVAVSEVQGYLYDAYRKVAPLLRALAAGGHGPELAGLAAELEAEAEELKERFDAAFWMADRDYYAIALDGNQAQVGTLSSDPGHCLWSGIIPEGRRRAVAERLMSEELFSGWGIRTLATGERTYNPMSYHNGSVWPHDNSLIALGLKRAGFDRYAARLAEALFEAASHFRYHRLPELFCGYPAGEGDPVEYPAACSPQAWAAATPFLLVQAILGLEPEAAAGRLRLRPLLPPSLGWVKLSHLRVGGALVDLEVTRQGVSATVRSGSLEVIVEQPAGEAAD